MLPASLHARAREELACLHPPFAKSARACPELSRRDGAPGSSRGATTYDSPGRQSWVSHKELEPSPVGTAETSREFEAERIGTIVTRPCKERKSGAPQFHDGKGVNPESVSHQPLAVLVLLVYAARIFSITSRIPSG